MMEMSDSGLLYVFLASAAIFLLLSVTVVLFVVVYQRKIMRQKFRLQKMESEHQIELMRSMLAAQEKERRRVARDLHDDIGSVLSAAKLNVELLARKAGKGKLEPGQFADARKVIGGAIEDVRRISHDLMPPTLEKDDLHTALRIFAVKFAQTTEIPFHLEVLGKFEGLTSGRRLSVYRIIQEMCNNTLKHAECNEIRLKLEYGDGILEINFEDDGKGFDYEVAKLKRESLGLKSLESRVSALKGKLQMESRPGAGTRAIVTLSTRTI